MSSGRIFKGEMKDGKPNGYGVMTYPNGDVCKGVFKDGEINGRVIYEYADGRLYEGTMFKGFPDGYGIGKESNGDYYEGEWKRGRRNGHGIYTFADGETIEGNFCNGERHGVITHTLTNGEIYTSVYIHGELSELLTRVRFKPLVFDDEWAEAFKIKLEEERHRIQKFITDHIEEEIGDLLGNDLTDEQLDVAMDYEDNRFDDYVEKRVPGYKYKVAKKISEIWDFLIERAVIEFYN